VGLEPGVLKEVPLMKPRTIQCPIILLVLGLALLASLPALARASGKVAERQSAAGSLPAAGRELAGGGSQTQAVASVQALTPSLDANMVAASQLQASPTVQEQTPLALQRPLALQMPLALQRARFERISTADGLSFPIVRHILQDRRGYMWFATDSGLNRYDGYEFTVYKHDPGDPTTMRFDDVRVIFEDRDGTLWVGGGGGLDRFDRMTETFTHVDTRGQVFSIYEDSAGTLWVGFWHGLYGYDRTTNEIIFSRQPNPEASYDWAQRSDSAVLAIHEDQRGDVWIGTDAGLYRLDRTSGVFTHYRHDPKDPTSLSSDSIVIIYEDRQGNLWVGTAKGLDLLDRSSDTFLHYRHDPGIPHSLSDGEVLSILEDSAGMLWVGTTNGLDQHDPLASDRWPASGQARSQNRFLHYQHDPQDPHSLSDNVVMSLFEDRSGVLWVGTTDGVNKYNRREDQFVRYQKHRHPPAAPVYTLDVSGLLKDPQPAILSDGRILGVYEDEDGILWIGTFGGGLNRLDRRSGRLTVYQHDPADATSLSSNMVGAILEDRAGVLWVGTGNGWLERFDRQTETFSHHQYLGEARLSAMAEDPAGNLWIGTAGEGLFRLDGARSTLVQYEQYWQDPDHWRRHGSLSSHVIASLYVDQAGVLWAGTIYGGINLWGEVEDRFTHYRRDPGNPNSLSHRQVLSIYEDPDEGVVWIGTGGGGLNRFDRATQTFTHYTEEDGLSGDMVGCILADDAGFLWLGTVKGLSRFDPRTETFRNYDRRDGVGVLSAGLVVPGSCLQSQTGEMFFGGSDGLYAFHPKKIRENLHASTVAITALKILNHTVRRDLPPDEHIQLPYQDNFISFEFTALDYTMPEKNQYAYMMEGLDKDWVYAGTRRYADYPDLKPGDYVFRVKGANSDGIWNEDGVAVRITVEPPIWQTWPFRVMAAVALVAGAIGMYLQRVKSVEARSHELEKQVQERTAELRREIDQRLQVEEALRKSEAEKAVTEERNRLARELHDSVTQSLYAVTLYADATARLLSSGQGETATDNLHKLRRTAKEALGEMRLLIFELRPPILEQEGLAAALQARLEAVEGRAGLKTEFRAEGEGRLPPDVEEGLYRITMEALNNALKHAQARSITVSLRLEPVAAVLEIADDGVGFDPATAGDRGGMGLRGMAERAEELGGRLTVESKPDSGTQITVQWAQDG
jgi:signal transduction histidine kinase/ligand-binding sensor domain-containing protein